MCRTLRLESQSSAGLRMQPYPRAPDLVWPGHLHGTGCLSARAVGTGFPTVGLRLWLGPGCGWSWVLFTPARFGWGLGWVCLGSVFGVVPLLPAVCGVRGWALVSACFRDLCGFARFSLAPRRFRFRCAVWACVLGPGLGCAPPCLAGLSGCVFCAFFFSACSVSLSRALWSLPPSPFFRAGLLAFFFFFFSACFGAPFSVGPLFLAWCCRLWLGGPPVSVWGSCLRCPLGWGFGPLLCCWRAVWWLWRVFAPPPPFFFFFFGGGGGGLPSCSSPCLPSAGACSVAGVWCGWSLATPGGGSCVLLPATPGWVSLPVVVGGPRHSWLGSAGGGGVWCVAVVCWWGCGWCVVWLVPRHSWRRFLCATPRHSWLGFAAAGGGRSPPLLAGVRLRRWCVVCGVWCVAVVCWWGCGWCVVWLVPRHSWRRFLCATPRHSWLGFAAGGGGRSPPLLAGVRLRRWCVVCGVWRWCVGGVVAGVWCGWSLATPGGGSCVLLPATPGWVSLPVVVGGPRHSWLGSACGGGVWCVVCGGGVLVGLWLVCGVVGPSPLLAEVPVCYSPPLLAGFRCRWWWAVPATPGWGPLAAVVCGVWCVVCGGGVLVGLCLVCGVVGPSPLLAEVPVCYSPPLLAGFRCRWWWAVPATPGWGPLAAVVCGVWCVAVVCWWGCGWCVVWLVLRHSWRRFLCATPRHSWLGFAAAGGGRSPPLLAGVRLRRRCVVCGGGVLVGLWLVCGVVGPSPLLAEVPVCYSPPLLAGFRCRWWWAVPATPGWGPLAAVVCVLCLAGSDGPASRARSGAPHLFLWPLCLSALLGPSPGWGCPSLFRCCCRSSLAGVCGVWVGCCLAPVRVPWFVACCARSPGLWHPVAVAAWHLSVCLGCGRRRASLACLVAPRGAPRLVRSGRSRCSGRLSRRRGAFPHPGSLRPRLYWAAARGTRRPAENRAHCACRWPPPRQGRWARSASYPFGAPRWGCPWRVPPASVLGCVRCGGWRVCYQLS